VILNNNAIKNFNAGAIIMTVKTQFFAHKRVIIRRRDIKIGSPVFCTA